MTSPLTQGWRNGRTRQGPLSGMLCSPIGNNVCTTFTQRGIQLVDEQRSCENLRPISLHSSPRVPLPGKPYPRRADINAPPAHIRGAYSLKGYLTSWVDEYNHFHHRALRFD
ncbi:hypothetical protein AVEN_51222-1 [Araneus ventricosus]|uniref:Uncharacterized protein n=1 Tax=Araneus ventricosus TaxID=182803 RepID=A0A4Y2VAN8_ARAVE|nr:hypothetical protein AVEN_51222-1 [Araneus ventricosus]